MIFVSSDSKQKQAAWLYGWGSSQEKALSEFDRECLPEIVKSKVFSFEREDTYMATDVNIFDIYVDENLEPMFRNLRHLFMKEGDATAYGSWEWNIVERPLSCDDYELDEESYSVTFIVPKWMEGDVPVGRARVTIEFTSVGWPNFMDIMHRCF